MESAIYCVQCRTPRNLYEFSYCSSCSQKLAYKEREIADQNKVLNIELAHQNKVLNTELTELRTMADLLQSRLAFLRLQSDIVLKPDVKILVRNHEEKPLYAHKIVLANRSSVFQRMFETEMLESETGMVRIDDATLPVIRAVLRFCYHGGIMFSPQVTAEEVLAVARKYAIAFLQQLCEEDLAKMIDKVTLPKVLTLAKKFEAKGLQKEALKYLKDNFDDVIVTVVDELCIEYRALE